MWLDCMYRSSTSSGRGGYGSANVAGGMQMSAWEKPARWSDRTAASTIQKARLPW